jgi:hypothetical protein
MLRFSSTNFYVINNIKIKNVNQNSNWREKHEQFLKSVRQARNISEAIKTGAPIPSNLIFSKIFLNTYHNPIFKKNLSRVVYHQIM